MNINKAINMSKGSSDKVNKKDSNKFRIFAKNFKLTYPRYSKNKKDKIPSKEILQNYLKSILSNLKCNILTLLTAYERSQDGYEHYHVLLCLDRLIDIKYANFFDYLSVHGDYAPLKGKPTKYAEYIKKDNDYIIYDPGINVQSASHRDQTDIMLYITRLVVKWKTDKRYSKHNHLNIYELFYKAWQSIKDHHTMKLSGTWKSRLSQFDCFMKVKYPHLVSDNIKYLRESFQIPIDVINWEKNYKYRRTLYVYGPSNLGKTEMCKSILQPHLFARSLEQSQDFLYGYHSGIILDDNDDIKKLSREQVIALLDRENTTNINVKHSNKTIPAKLPIIIISNLSPLEIFSTSCYFYCQNGEKKLRSEIARRLYCCKVQKDLRRFLKDLGIDN